MWSKPYVNVAQQRVAKYMRWADFTGVLIWVCCAQIERPLPDWIDYEGEIFPKEADTASRVSEMLFGRGQHFLILSNGSDQIPIIITGGHILVGKARPPRHRLDDPNV
jgi:hypothetical protein